MSKKRSRTTEVDISVEDIGDIMGSATGKMENSLVSGGWAGTDDATSTAPSDMIGLPPIPEEDKPISVIERDFNESIERDEEEQSIG